MVRRVALIASPARVELKKIIIIILDEPVDPNTTRLYTYNIRLKEVNLVEQNKNLTVWDESYSRMMAQLKSYVTRIQSTQPIDPMGRVTALVNPQAILATGFTSSAEALIDSPPDGALLPVSYLEGLPTVEGLPIWEKLEGEKLEYYDVFKRYRNMRDAKTQRAVFKLALETGLEVRQLEMLRQIYHWNIRVQAYDEYLAKERAVNLELRRLEIEGKHAKTAEKLYKMSADYLGEHPELLTPKLAMQMLEMAIRLERISSGMSPDNKGTIGAYQDRPTVNITNNVGSSPQPQSQATLVTDDKEANKERLTQVLNIMNTVGLLKERPEIIDVDIEAIEGE